MESLQIILNKIDIALVAIFLMVVISLYGFCLFGYEWWRKKEASFIFKCITILFLGQFVDNVVGFYGRYTSIFVSFVEFERIRLSFFWSIKDIINIIVLFLICLYMTKRLFIKVDYIAEAQTVLSKQEILARGVLEKQKTIVERSLSQLLKKHKVIAENLLEGHKVIAEKLLEKQRIIAEDLLEKTNNSKER